MCNEQEEPQARTDRPPQARADQHPRPCRRQSRKGGWWTSPSHEQPDSHDPVLGMGGRTDVAFLVGIGLLVGCARQASLSPKPRPTGIDPVVACASVTGAEVRELFYPAGQLA